MSSMEHGAREFVYGEKSDESQWQASLSTPSAMVEYRFYGADGSLDVPSGATFTNLSQLVEGALSRDSTYLMHGDHHRSVSMRLHPHSRAQETACPTFEFKEGTNPTTPYKHGVGSVLNPLFQMLQGSQAMVFRNTSSTANMTVRVSGWRAIAVESHARSSLTEDILFRGDEGPNTRVAPVAIGHGASISQAVSGNTQSLIPHHVSVQGAGRDSDPPLSGIAPPNHQRSFLDVTKDIVHGVVGVTRGMVEAVANVKMAQQIYQSGRGAAVVAEGVALPALEGGATLALL